MYWFQWIEKCYIFLICIWNTFLSNTICITSTRRGQRADGKELGLQELHATASKVHGIWCIYGISMLTAFWWGRPKGRPYLRCYAKPYIGGKMDLKWEHRLLIDFTRRDSLVFGTHWKNANHSDISFDWAPYAIAVESRFMRHYYYFYYYNSRTDYDCAILSFRIASPNDNHWFFETEPQSMIRAVVNQLEFPLRLL